MPFKRVQETISLEGHSETSNDQALLNPFDHFIKMKAYMRVDCFQHSLEGHSESSNDQALLNLFDQYIKMKAYMRVERGTLYPGVDCPPLLTMFLETRYEKLFQASS